jgi:nitrogen-specific signal transduction histidine kinase
MKDVAGRLSYLAAATIDMTREKEAQERLAQAQRLDSLGQLTGGIAHDFNNLLTVINGSAELIADAVTGQPELFELATVVQAAGEKAADLTGRLLAFARRQTLNPKLVRPDEIVSGMRAMLTRALGADVALNFELACAECFAMADQAQLEAAILNLCVNARDAMPRGGSLTIVTSKAVLEGGDRGSVPTGMLPATQYASIAVCDSGTGMSSEVLAHAFEPFFTTKRTGAGTGLGLSMVYGFARQSNGHVSIDSREGAGTTVKLYLPLVTETGQEFAAPVEASLPGGGEHILLVEDDDAVRTYVARALDALGYRVEAAVNADEALQRLAQKVHYDLLLTDVVMPGEMNGIELARAARLLRPDMRVLYTTGNADRNKDFFGPANPEIQLLHKPYRRAELARKVRVALGKEVQLPPDAASASS